MSQRRFIPRGGMTVGPAEPAGRLRRSLPWATRALVALLVVSALGASGAALLATDDSFTVGAVVGARAPQTPAATPRVTFDATPLASPRAPLAASAAQTKATPPQARAPRPSPSLASRDPGRLRRSLLATDLRSARERMRRLLAEADKDARRRAELLRIDRTLGLGAAPRPARANPGSTANGEAAPERVLDDADQPLASRSAAAWQLAAQDERGLEALLQATGSREPSTRMLAAQALGRRADDPRAHNVLLALQQDPEQQVRLAAGRALRRSEGARRSRRSRRRRLRRQG